MLNIDQLLPYYPEQLHPFREFILREYLQYKLLDIIYSSEYGQQLVFLGGTCLRIVHQNTRFSEDLDFDTTGLTEDKFNQLGKHIANQLSKEGYEVEIKTIFRGAFHCYIKFPALLFQEGLSGHRQQKILIQLDTEPQHFDYKPEVYILNKFDVFTTIQTTPVNLLLSQKLFAILNRKRNKGRDFFDVVFLLGRNAKPDYQYLKQKMKIRNQKELKEALLSRCESIDMNTMADDVAAFLFQSKEVNKVKMFQEYIKQINLS